MVTERLGRRVTSHVFLINLDSRPLCSDPLYWSYDCNWLKFQLKLAYLKGRTVAHQTAKPGLLFTLNMVPWELQGNHWDSGSFILSTLLSSMLVPFSVKMPPCGNRMAVTTSIFLVILAGREWTEYLFLYSYNKHTEISLTGLVPVICPFLDQWQWPQGWNDLVGWVRIICSPSIAIRMWGKVLPK
jgi:hypothetical protein